MKLLSVRTCAALFAAALLTPAQAAAPATLRVGDVAPDFVMKNLAGADVRLSDYKDKVVVLDFWATWCGPCIASFPHTQTLAAKYKDQGVVVLASGTSDTIAKFRAWIPVNQPKYPDLVFTWDANERDSATFAERASSKLYGVTGIPTQFVIGRDGKIAGVIVGNGGATDPRTEAALATAGIKVDPTIVAAADAKAKASAAVAAEKAKNPPPPFRESYGKLKAGDAIPDFAVITIRYTPKMKCVESKSLKLYLHSFRNTGSFAEAVTNRVLDDLVRAISPAHAVVTGEFAARGGVALKVSATFGKSR